MPRLLSSALRLRRDPRILKLPPYLSLLCILTGVVWLLLLPLDDYSRRTYISENALLPGQVHTYFGGSDQNVFRAYKHEVEALEGKSNVEINDKLESIALGLGLKVGRQNFSYPGAAATLGKTHAGENLYAILRAPRGDATEAIVLVAAWRNTRDELNTHGVALAWALARYFRRWSLWSKDIVFLVTPDSIAGPQAWVDAYHDDGRAPPCSDTAGGGRRGAGSGDDGGSGKEQWGAGVGRLSLKSGALQGAVALDYPGGTRGRADGRFDKVHVVYDGVSGQLPNLDLINSVVNIAGGQMSMGVALQEMWDDAPGGGKDQRREQYEHRLRTMLRGMAKQGLGVATGPHSAFIPYHVDAVTLQPYGAGGWHDEMAMGGLVESSFRSLNNLLEHLHQSFFFYLLMEPDRFVSIGTYLPSAMLVAANFTITAIALWVKSGQAEDGAAAAGSSGKKGAVKLEGTGKDGDRKKETDARSRAVERDLFLPLGVVAACQFAGVVPLYLFTHLPEKLLTPTFALFVLINAALPHLASRLLSAPSPSSCLSSSSSTTTSSPASARPAASAQQYQLVTSFSLLLLGMFLSALATLNFSLALIVGLLASPLTFVRPVRAPSRRLLGTVLLNLVSPPAAVIAAGAAAWWWGFGVSDGAAAAVAAARSAAAAAAAAAGEGDGGLAASVWAGGWLGGLGGLSAAEMAAGVWRGVNTVLREASFAWNVSGTYTPVVVWCVWWPAWLAGGIALLGRPGRRA